MTSILAPHPRPQSRSTESPVTPLSHQELKPHGPYRHYFPKYLLPATIMADEQSPKRDDLTTSENLFEAAKSVGEELKGKLFNGDDSPRRKSQGFDIYRAQRYLDVLKPVLSHRVSDTTHAPEMIVVAEIVLQELIERHGNGAIGNIEILVATTTIKHDNTKIGKTNRSEGFRNDVWLLVLLADADEEDKIGQSFSLDTRFNVVEGEIFICFTVE